MTKNLATNLPPIDLIDIKTYRSILCLHGDLPDRDFFTQCALPVFAADGAANQLAQIGISPQAIIGDLDSASPLLQSQYPSVYLPNQDIGDFEKSLTFLDQQGLLPCIVTGINGGYLDHILNNVDILISSNCLLYAPPLIGLTLKENDIKNFSLKIGTKISLLAMPHAQLTTSGLKWELKDATLSFPGHHSCFNRTIKSTITLQMHKGILLVLIYQQDVIDAGLLSSC
jgi:thiamine pyrophosphokinase